jgi:soluble lytic murein transglycosylase-like protein
VDRRAPSPQAGFPERTNLGGGVMRLWVGLLLLGGLYGCGGGGLIPNGPHAMNPDALAHLIRVQAAQSGLSPKLVGAVIEVESHGDPSAVSATGAAGLMQLMPDTALSYGVSNRFDPEDNVMAGSRYLRDLLARYHDNLSLALAAYNAGPGAVDAHRGMPSFPETRAYVARVNAVLRNSTF